VEVATSHWNVTIPAFFDDDVQDHQDQQAVNSNLYCAVRGEKESQ
jgi:hypothetical protein